MKNKLQNDEALLREKLRSHEFPADEQAWEHMERLLDGVPAPSAPFAGNQTGIPASFPIHQMFNWFTALGVGGLMLFLTVSGSTTVRNRPSQEERHEELSLPVATPDNVAFENNKGIEPSPTSHKASEGQNKSATSSGNPASGQSKPATSAGAAWAGQSKSAASPGASPSSASKKRENKQFVLNGKGTAAHNFNPNRNAEPVKNKVEATGSQEMQTSQAVSVQQIENQPSTAEGQELASAMIKEAVPELQNTLAIAPLTPIDFQPLLLKKPTPERSAISIQPKKIFKERKSQIGIALGGQSAVVNRRQKVFDLLPAFGVSMKHQISPKWALQADLMYKKVKGYNWSVSASDQGFSALGNYQSWSVNSTTKELVLIEMPVLVKRQLMSRKQSVFVGFRPAWISAVPGEGNSSYYFNSAQNSDRYSKYSSIQNGIRHFDLAFTLGFEARLWKNLWVDVRCSQGFFDLTYDNFFNNSYTDTTTDTQLTLRYYFWSF